MREPRSFGCLKFHFLPKRTQIYFSCIHEYLCKHLDDTFPEKIHLCVSIYSMASISTTSANNPWPNNLCNTASLISASLNTRTLELIIAGDFFKE